jgi:hypothetical protein
MAGGIITLPFLDGNGVVRTGAFWSSDATITGTISPIPFNTGGIGPMTAVPSGSANGTAIGSPPSGYTGCRIYLSAGDSVTFTIASSQPGSPPAATYTVTQSTTGPNWDEPLANGANIYVTAMSGAPKFRFK